jgi:hypothetical protein
MDHNEAVRLHAAEKYLLGELPKEQHAEYEEHYFDCTACAEEIKTTAAFMEGARQVVREGAAEVVGARQPAVPPVRAGGGWFAWLRPAFAVPVFAALLVFIGYQNGVTIPRLKSSSSSLETGQTISSSFPLRGSVRGESENPDVNKVHVRSGETFTVNFDFTPSGTFSEYAWELRDQAARLVKSGSIGGEKKYQRVALQVAGGVESAGKYSLAFFGSDGSQSRSEAQRLTFTVEFPQ